MKSNCLFGGAVAVAIMMIAAGFQQPTVDAQQAGAWPPIRVACLNVAQVFRTYKKYQDEMALLKQDIETQENKLRGMQETVQAKMAQMQQITAQADRDRVEKEIADMRFQFERDRRNLQTQFVQREAEVFSTIYAQMTELLERYCKDNGIHMVIRLKGDVAEEARNNPQAVLETINRQVVYWHPNLDLTQVITDGMNQLAK